LKQPAVKKQPLKQPVSVEVSITPFGAKTMMDDNNEAYHPGDNDPADSEDAKDDYIEGNWRNAMGLAQSGRPYSNSQASPAINTLFDAASTLVSTNNPPMVVEIPFDLLRLKKVDMTRDREYLIRTQPYMQAFTAKGYTPLDETTQTEDEYNKLLAIWLEEYNTQRDNLNLNVRFATERHIIEVANKMGLTLGGQQPTGYRDVMNIIKSRENWTGGGKELHMQQFLYRAKYGEYKDRKIAWITRYEQEWKALNNIVYMARPTQGTTFMHGHNQVSIVS
jgi:hypothetical protein